MAIVKNQYGAFDTDLHMYIQEAPEPNLDLMRTIRMQMMKDVLWNGQDAITDHDGWIMGPPSGPFTLDKP